MKALPALVLFMLLVAVGYLQDANTAHLAHRLEDDEARTSATIKDLTAENAELREEVKALETAYIAMHCKPGLLCR